MEDKGNIVGRHALLAVHPPQVIFLDKDIGSIS